MREGGGRRGQEREEGGKRWGKRWGRRVSVIEGVCVYDV